MSKRKDKISTDGAGEALENNPFASLEIAGLPPVEEASKSPAQPSKPVVKPKYSGTVYLRLDKSGRGGKEVVVVEELRMGKEPLKALQKELQQLCATGGTLKDGQIEIQGNHRERIKKHLESLGFQVKLKGS